MTPIDVAYQSRWRHRRWIDVAVAAAFPLTPLFFAVWDASGAPSLGVGLSDLPKIMALSGVFGACVPAAWWWARVVPAVGRVIEPEFRHEMRLTPTPPAEIVSVEVTTRAWWASLVLPAHIVVVCAGAIAEAVRVSSQEIVWTMMMVATIFCLFLVVAFRATQGLAWSLAVLHCRHGRGGWLTWSWIQFAVGLALANVLVYGAGPSGLVLLETLMNWLSGLTRGGASPRASIVIAVVTVGVAYSSLALYGMGLWIGRSRRALVELLGRPDDADEMAPEALANTPSAAALVPSALARWGLGMGTPALLIEASMGVWTSGGAAPLVLLAGLIVAVATLRWVLATTTVGAMMRPAAALLMPVSAAIGPGIGVAITTAAMTLWLVQPDPFVWIDLDPIERLQGVAGLLAATFVAIVFLLASGELFLRRGGIAPAHVVRRTLQGAVLVLVAWTLQGLVLIPMVFTGSHLRNRSSIGDTPGVLASSLLILLVLLLIWLMALRGWWGGREKSITAVPTTS